MRILQVHNRYLQPGGEDVAVATEARILRDAGHHVTTFEVRNPAAARAAVAHLTAAPWNPRAAERIQEEVRRQRPDVVHVHNTWYVLTPAVLSAVRATGAPVVVTLHNYRTVCAAATLFRDGAPCTDCVGGTAWPGIRHRCYRGSVVQSAVAATTIDLHRARRTWHRDVDRFLTLTEFGREVHAAAGLPAERIVVKSNSTDDPGPRRRPPSASSQVVYVGRLTEEKGIRDLLAAWRGRPARLELVVVGDGPLRAELEASAPPGVRFVGARDKPWVTRLLLEARALVFPSIWYEGQGLVALEAAAAGLPVTHPELGAMADLFAPDAGALTYRPRDPADLTAALERLGDDRHVDVHGRLTRRRFEERYTHEVARTTLEATYEAVRR